MFDVFISSPHTSLPLSALLILAFISPIRCPIDADRCTKCFL